MRCRSFLALFDVKGHPVSLIERFESRFVDAGMMKGYIRAIFLGDKTVTFLIGGHLPTGFNPEAGFVPKKVEIGFKGWKSGWK